MVVTEQSATHVHVGGRSIPGVRGGGWGVGGEG